MKLFKGVVVAVALFILSGCGASLKYVAPTVEKMDSLKIDQVQEKTVGETMIEVVDAVSKPGFIAVSDYQIPGSFMTTYPLIRRGDTCAVLGSLDNGDLACSLSTKPVVAGSGPVAWEYCLVFGQDGTPYGDTSCSMIYVRNWGGKPAGIFKASKYYLKDSFKKELVYNGRSKDMVKFLYREYKDDFARSAFNQDLIYDLSESKEIGFRGMKIVILEATNASVKFIVKSPMQ